VYLKHLDMDKKKENSFGKKLGMVLSKEHKTQKAIAKEMGMSPQMLTNIKLGRPPTWEQLNTILEYFANKTDPNYFFSTDSKTEETSVCMLNEDSANYKSEQKQLIEDIERKLERLKETL